MKSVQLLYLNVYGYKFLAISNCCFSMSTVFGYMGRWKSRVLYIVWILHNVHWFAHQTIVNNSIVKNDFLRVLCSKCTVCIAWYVIFIDKSITILRYQKLGRSEEHTSELQSPDHLVCRLLLEKKKKTQKFKLINKEPSEFESTHHSGYTGTTQWQALHSY